MRLMRLMHYLKIQSSKWSPDAIHQSIDKFDIKLLY